MFSGIGLSEIMVVMLLALLVLGPEKLPDAARKLGKGMRELRRASNMFTDMFMLEEDAAPKKSATPASGEASTPANGGAHSPAAGSFEPPPYEYKEGDSIAREFQKRAPTRPVLLSSVRRPTHIESVRLSPRLQKASQEASSAHIEIAPMRGVGT